MEQKNGPDGSLLVLIPNNLPSLKSIEILRRERLLDLPSGSAFVDDDGCFEPRTPDGPEAVRFRRWERLAGVRRLLYANFHKNNKGYGLKTCYCHYNIRHGLSAVEIWRRGDAPSHYRNLMACGSVWLCPVCQVKISERRRIELKQAMDAWALEGGVVWLATYTFSHGRHDDLADTLKRLSKARRLMNSGRGWLAIKAAFGVFGSVLSAEITHGEINGWHPHFHELIFLKPGAAFMGDFRADMFQRWRSACVSVGLGEPSFSRGFDVRAGDEAGDYVCKMGDDQKLAAGSWSLDAEMTKGHIKKAAMGSRSPVQILDSAIDIENSDAVRARARSLWLEYAVATKGRSQLHWSKGLKKYFAVEDIDDQTLVAAGDSQAVLLASIADTDWLLIRRARLQHVVLECCNLGLAHLSALIDRLRVASSSRIST